MGWNEVKPWLLWLLALPIVGGAFWYFSGDQRAARQCDSQIQAKLAAPSTYKRIDFFTSEASGGRVVYVEYEAQNVMGVPLQQHDRCTVAD